MVAGAPKVSRKSLMLMSLGLDIARGVPWLGKFGVSSRPVVYTALEDGNSRLGQRLRALGVTRATHHPTRMRYVTDPTAHLELMSALDVTGIEPHVWMIDTLADLMGIHGIEDENNSLELTNMLRPYREMCQRHGHSLMLPHHHARERDTYRGSGAIAAAIDGWWNVTLPPSDKTITLLTPTLRDGNAEPWYVKFNQAGERIWFSSPSELEIEAACKSARVVGRGRTKGAEKEERSDGVSKSAAVLRALLRDNTDARDRWARGGIEAVNQLKECLTLQAVAGSIEAATLLLKMRGTSKGSADCSVPRRAVAKGSRGSDRSMNNSPPACWKSSGCCKCVLVLTREVPTPVVARSTCGKARAAWCGSDWSTAVDS
jgi:hypothetical protein